MTHDEMLLFMGKYINQKYLFGYAEPHETYVYPKTAIKQNQQIDVTHQKGHALGKMDFRNVYMIVLNNFNNYRKVFVKTSL